ncbi:MAG: hypothetical protein R2764_10870 [Bacteroidales bacterium]
MKFTDGKRLSSRGPIFGFQSTFTSMNDDTEGGDTNNDADATVPQPGDGAGLNWIMEMQKFIL